MTKSAAVVDELACTRCRCELGLLTPPWRPGAEEMAWRALQLGKMRRGASRTYACSHCRVCVFVGEFKNAGRVRVEFTMLDVDLEIDELHAAGH